MARRRRVPILFLLAAVAALLVLRFFPDAEVARHAGLPDPWTSREACEAALAAGTKRTRPDGVVRVVSWNLRWFPDGSPRPGGPHATDVPWLACTLAWLDADLVAVQEVKDGAAADAAMADLLDRTSRASGGRWQRVEDRCPRDGREHLAILWDDVRLQVGSPADVAALNPKGSACAGRLRPGLSAIARSRRGGLDFQAIVVHADSGRLARDRDHRTDSARALAALDAPEGEADVVALGDWNTMGQDEPEETAETEIAALDRELGDAFARVAAAGALCSHFYRKRPSALDHVFVSIEMQEAKDARVEVDGYCRLAACQRLRGPEPPAYERLSDHCPIVVDLVDADLDGAATPR